MTSALRSFARGLLLVVVGAAMVAPSLASAQTLQVRIREAVLDPAGLVRLVVSIAGDPTGKILGPENFSLTEEGAPVGGVKVEPLFESKAQPVSIVLLIDVSGSTKGQPLEDAKSASKAFLAQIPQGARVSVIAFGKSAEMKMDFTEDRSALVAAIDSLQASGETALYDGIAAAAVALGRNDGLHNIVLFSDGKDTVSGTSLQGAIEAARSVKAQVTSVGLVTADFDQTSLQNIAAQTGGTTLSVSQSRELFAAFNQVARDIASQYVLTYNETRLSPKELGLEVRVNTDAGSASDQIAVINPRIAPPDDTSDFTPASGPLTTKIGLWLGVASAGLAILLVMSILLRRTEGMSSRRALRRGMHFYDADKERDQSQGAAETIARRAAVLVDQVPKPKGFEERLQLRLDRAGWPLRSNEFLGIQAIGTISIAFLGGVLLSSLWLGLLLGILAPFVGRMVLTSRIEKRKTSFLTQLPDTLQVLAGSLQAGYGLVQAIDTVTKESSAPTSTEFARVMSETRLGMPLEDAMDSMATRMDNEDFRWVVMAINIQRQVGGNLAVLLETVAGTLREREQLRRQVKVLSAEGRLSAWILSLLPFLVALYLAVVNPAYLGLLTGTTIGRMMIVMAMGLLGLGVLWMRKIIRIEM